MVSHSTISKLVQGTVGVRAVRCENLFPRLASGVSRRIAVCECALAHFNNDHVEAVYRRSGPFEKPRESTNDRVV